MSSTTIEFKFLRGVREDIEQEDEVESYLRWVATHPNASDIGEEPEEWEYDDDGLFTSIFSDVFQKIVNIYRKARKNFGNI